MKKTDQFIVYIMLFSFCVLIGLLVGFYSYPEIKEKELKDCYISYNVCKERFNNECVYKSNKWWLEDEFNITFKTDN